MYKKKDKQAGKKGQTGEEQVQLFVQGLKNMTVKGAIAVVLTLLIAIQCIKSADDIGQLLGISPLFTIFTLLIPFAIILGYGAKSPKTEEEQFRSIGLTNSNGEAPELIRKTKSKSNEKIEERTYHSEGIPIEKWIQKRTEIEAALDCSVVFVERVNETKKEILLGVIDSKYAIPTKIEWDDSFIPGLKLDNEEEQQEETVEKKKKDSKLVAWLKKIDTPKAKLKSDGAFDVVLGETITGPLIIDLDSLPHMVIGGTTGSGKSVLLRSVLWQCVRKGAKAYIIDFKGGVEFGGKWESFASIYTERETAIEMLTMLQMEMEDRFKLFKRYGCKNLEDYNRKFPEMPLARIILACDEVGSMLNKQGADKETKADLAVISKVLMELAMKSRAAGINMLLATQRPDAETLPGQLRSNLPVRICGQVGGKAGLSEIVLDDPIAGTISERQKGRFFCNVSGMTELQGYMFSDERHMTDGDYQKGTLLVSEEAMPVPEPREQSPVDPEEEYVNQELTARDRLKNIEIKL